MMSSDDRTLLVCIVLVFLCIYTELKHLFHIAAGRYDSVYSAV